MKRREFLFASAAATAATVGLARLSGADAGGEASNERQLLELRTYHFATPAKQSAYEQFLGRDAVPAFNRAGVRPVGVFKLLAKDNPDLHLSADDLDLYVLLPHESAASVVALEQRLAADEAYQQAGRSVLDAPKTDPAFVRYDSTLLLGMSGFPRVQVPTKSAARVLQLRTYESHSAGRAANKISMFNAGEFGIFQTAGMPGVFFGGAIVGLNLPQLTYMVAHEEMADVKRNWDAFFAAPEWKKLSGDPGYKDNVSKVINLLLRPCEGSQI